jgi:hypothetical protein
MVASFGSGSRYTPKRMVETTRKVAAPPHAGLARESLTLRVDGAEQVVEVVRQERFLGGTQAYWVCSRCGALRSHLYAVAGALACRCCHRLGYWSWRVPARGGSGRSLAPSTWGAAWFVVAAAAKAATLEPRPLQAASRRAYRNGARACGDARWYDPRARKAKGSAAWTKMIVTIRCWESG